MKRLSSLSNWSKLMANEVYKKTYRLKEHHLFKEGLRLAQNVFEFCQLQEAFHQSFIVSIAVFHFILKLFKLSLKNNS